MNKINMQQLIMGWGSFLIGAGVFMIIPRPLMLVSHFGMNEYVALGLYFVTTIMMFYSVAMCPDKIGKLISSIIGGILLYQIVVTILGSQAAWYSIWGGIVLGFFLANNIAYWFAYMRHNSLKK